MHVHDSLNRPHFSPQTTARSAENVNQKGTTERTAEVEGGNGFDEASAYTPAPEVIQLLTQLREFPEVRDEVIKEVTERLAKGVYLTRVAAEQAAGAIIES